MTSPHLVVISWPRVMRPRDDLQFRRVPHSPSRMHLTQTPLPQPAHTPLVRASSLWPLPPLPLSSKHPPLFRSSARYTLLPISPYSPHLITLFLALLPTPSDPLRAPLSLAAHDRTAQVGSTACRSGCYIKLRALTVQLHACSLLSLSPCALSAVPTSPLHGFWPLFLLPFFYLTQ